MTKPFKEFLTTLINQNYISVFNDESGSEYTIPASELAAVLIDPRTLNTPSYNPEELEAGDFFLSCEYFVDGSMPYGLYTLKYGDTLLESAKTPVLSKPTNKPARDLIDLARVCSKKIIAQQKLAEARNMIMGMSSDNTYTS